MTNTPEFDRNRLALATWLQSKTVYDREVTKPAATLRGYLEGASVDDATAAYQLRWLYHWAIRKGVYDLLEGQPGALDVVSRASLYGAWWFRCQFAVALKNAKPGGEPVFALRELGLLSAHALALGWFADADILAAKIDQAIESDLVHGESVTSVGAFLVRLHAKRRGRKLPKTTEKLATSKGYKQLLDGYDSDNLDIVTGAFRTACDFHVRQSRDLGESDTPDFFEEVYRLYPVELLAVLRLRESLNLPLPVIPHILMTGPAGTLHPITPPAPDPILRSVVERLHASYPDL